MQIKFLQESLNELDSAKEYYENIAEGLRDRFLKEISLYFEKISKFPNLYPYENEKTQKVILQTFPYIIYYQQKESYIVIVAIFHTSQNPKKLKSRIR